MPSFVFHVHFIANPFCSISLILLVPEAAVIGDVGVFPAALELLAVGAFFVDCSFFSSSSAVTRAAAVPSFVAVVVA